MTARCSKSRRLPVRLALGFCGTARDLWVLARHGLVVGVLLGAKGLCSAAVACGLKLRNPYRALCVVVYVVAWSLFLAAAFVVSFAGLWLLSAPWHLLTSAVFGLVFGAVLRGVINEVLEYAKVFDNSWRKEPTP